MGPKRPPVIGACVREYPMKLVMAAAFAALAAGPAAAQSTFGDTQLAYQDGVVYDDDLVPGRGLNTPFLYAEQSPRPNLRNFDQPYYDGARPRNSANLIGADGRASGYYGNR